MKWGTLMDALLQEIAKTFNIGNDAIQNIIENYPQLRQQIATYNFMESIRTLMVILGASSFFAFVFSTFTGIVQAVEYAQPSYCEGAGKRIVSILKKASIALAIVFVLSGVVFVIATYIQATQSPDVVVIKSILDKK